MSNPIATEMTPSPSAELPAEGSLAVQIPPPRIILVLATYLPESFGGAEQQSRKLAVALGRLGAKVTVLAPRVLSATPNREDQGSISLRRLRVRRPPNLGGRHFGSFVVWSLKVFWWLTKHRADYDVIHVIHGRLHAIPAVLAGRILRKPTLIKIGRGGVEHFDIDVLNRKKLLGRMYARTLVTNATAYIANSREIVDDLKRWRVPSGRIHQIPNGVDIADEIVRRAEGTVRFVYLGRLDPEKAIDLMIRGFGELADKSRVKLTLVGDGECRDGLETLVDKLELRDKVTFAGSVSDVGPALLEADVFVSTSLSEGMSNALLEAMSFGVMPLVSRVSGVAEIVEEGRSGLLFPPGDLAAFTAKLSSAIGMPRDERTAYGQRAREAVAGRYGIDEVAAQHVRLYRRLLAGTGMTPERSGIQQ
jgi:glycosyltransferase involved in cell wall biosynthesis